MFFIRKLFGSKPTHLPMERVNSDLSSKVEAFVKERPTHIAYKDDEDFFAWAAQLRGYTKALKTCGITKYNDQLESLAVAVYARVHMRNRMRHVGDMKRRVLEIRKTFPGLEQMFNDVFRQLPSAEKPTPVKMTWDNEGIEGSIQDEIVDVKGPLADTDLVVFADDYNGVLPNNGVHLKEFKRLQTLYRDICEGRTKLKVSKKIKKKFDQALKLFLTRSTSRRLIDGLLDHPKITQVKINQVEPGEDCQDGKTGLLTVGWSGADMNCMGQGGEKLHMPAFITLAHELAHALAAPEARGKLVKKKASLGRDWSNKEELINISGLSGHLEFERQPYSRTSLESLTVEELEKELSRPSEKQSNYVRPINENSVRAEFGLPPRLYHVGMPKGLKGGDLVRALTMSGMVKELKTIDESHFKGLGDLDDVGHPIVMAIEEDRPEVFFALRKRLGVKKVDKSVMTNWLSVAAAHRSIKVMDILLNTMGWSAKMTDEYGQTLIHRVVLTEETPSGTGTLKQMIDMLVEAGVDVNAKDDDGKTALDWAKEDRFKEAIDLLSSML